MAEYRIILQNAGGSASSAGVKISAGSNGTSIRPALQEQQARASMPLEALYPVTVAQSAWNVAKSVGNAYLSHYVNTAQLRTGSSALQSRLQFGYEIGSFAMGTLESVAMGAAVGGAPGAILGAVSSVVQTMFGYMMAQKTINLQTAVEDVSIKENAIRAGTGGSRLGRAGYI